MNQLIKMDEEYRKWIEDIGKRYKQRQIKASVSVNQEMLHTLNTLSGQSHSKISKILNITFHGNIPTSLGLSRLTASGIFCLPSNKHIICAFSPITMCS